LTPAELSKTVVMRSAWAVLFGCTSIYVSWEVLVPQSSPDQTGSGWVPKIWVRVREGSSSNGLPPTLSKGAKDGAPGCLGWFEENRQLPAVRASVVPQPSGDQAPSDGAPGGVWSVGGRTGNGNCLRFELLCFPNHRAIRRPQDGAPGGLWSVAGRTGNGNCLRFPASVLLRMDTRAVVAG
jgi:hypothetical protein